MLRHLPYPSLWRALIKSHRLSLVLFDRKIWCELWWSRTAYQQEGNLSTSTNVPLTFTCSQNENQLLVRHNEHLLLSGLQTTVVGSHKRVLLKLPVFTLFYACIYDTNSGCVHKCMSIHVGIYVYTRWYLLASSWVPSTSKLTPATLRILRRERFSTMIRVAIRTSGTWIQGAYKCRWMPMKE